MRGAFSFLSAVVFAASISGSAYAGQLGEARAGCRIGPSGEVSCLRISGYLSAGAISGPSGLPPPTPFANTAGGFSTTHLGGEPEAGDGFSSTRLYLGSGGN